MRVLALIRLPHWVKNAFVIAPLFFARKVDEGPAVVDAVAAFFVFSFVASAAYVLNDWCDREEDARHPLKSRRPLASGELGARNAFAVGAGCLVLAVAIGLAAGLPLVFWAVVGGYALINVAYSTLLRHVDLVDISVIAAGFVLRVLAGTTAIHVEASQWIILSTGLLALLLALGKRRTDLAQEEGQGRRRSLDGYTVEFIDTALAALAASVIGFYALYTVSDYAVHRFSDDLYLTTFWVVIGIVRYLQLVIAHGRLGSPTDIALRDRPLQVIVAAWALTFYLLAYHLGS